MKINYSLLIISVVIMSSMVIVLRAQSNQRNSAEINGMNYISSIEAVTSAPEWSDNFSNPSDWRATYLTPATLNYTLSVNNLLNLTVSFPDNPYASQSVQVSRQVNISLDNSPLVIANVTVQQGVSYGVRFSGVDAANQRFLAWTERDQFQHRQGLGHPEILQANLALETYLATGAFPEHGSRITEIVVYIEIVPGRSGPFSLVASELSALSMERRMQPLPPSPIMSGDYFALLVNMNSSFQAVVPAQQDIFQVYAGFYMRGSQDLEYNVYYNNGTTEQAESYLYVAPSPLTQYNFATISPQNVRDFPPIVPDSENSSSIIVVAKQGQIESFQINTLSFRFLSNAIALSSDVDANLAQSLFIYYIVFLFVTPVTIVVLLSKGFTVEEKTPPSQDAHDKQS